MAAATGAIVELQRNSPNWATIVEEIVKLERKIFPKHESLARSFDEELRKKNSGLLYYREQQVDGEEVAGYVMYSWPSSLYASITKLAGFKSLLFSSTFHPCQFAFLGETMKPISQVSNCKFGPVF